MILLVFAALGLLIGLLTGGSLRGLSQYPLKGLLLPVGALLIKAGAAQFFTPQTGALAVCLVQYAMILLFVFLNLRRPVWPAFVGLGSLLNLLVIAFNGGCMPVAASLLEGAGERMTLLAEGRIYAYCLMDGATRLPFLGDVIRIGPVGVPLGFASAGDVALCVGVAILVYQMTKARANPKVKQTENTTRGNIE